MRLNPMAYLVSASHAMAGGQGADADFGSLESLIILGVVTVACTGLAVFTVGRSAQQARI